MNEFKLTKNAEKIVEFYENISTPASVQECIKGVFSGSCDKTPDLTKGINKIFNLIKSIKQEIKKDYEDYEDKYKKTDRYSLFDKDLTFFLDNCTVFLVTTDDVKKKRMVKDLFTQNKRRIPIPFPEGKHKIDEKNAVNYLGVYTPKTGSIFLFVDLIYLHDENPELLFQKVLLHEFIHAFLDVVPRIIKDGQVKNLIPVNKIEEPYDNTLVLYTYHWSYVDQTIFDYIENFISNQAYPYNHAIDYYNRGTGLNVFKIILKEFLKGKFLATPSKLNSFSCLTYSINEEGSNCPLFIPQIKALIPNDLQLLKEEDKESIKSFLEVFPPDGDLPFLKKYVAFSPFFPHKLTFKTKYILDSEITLSLLITFRIDQKSNDIYPIFDLVGQYQDLKIVFSYEVNFLPSFVIKSNFTHVCSTEVTNLLRFFYQYIWLINNEFVKFVDLDYSGELTEEVRTKLIELFPGIDDSLSNVKF